MDLLFGQGGLAYAPFRGSNREIDVISERHRVDASSYHSSSQQRARNFNPVIQKRSFYYNCHPMTPLTLTPLTSLRISRHQIPRYKLLPNTSIQKHPLTSYHSCFPSTATPSDIESHLKSIGVVVPQWRYTMYSRSHFHTTTHEVLCIANGKAKLCMYGFSLQHQSRMHACLQNKSRPGLVIPLQT